MNIEYQRVKKSVWKYRRYECSWSVLNNDEELISLHRLFFSSPVSKFHSEPHETRLPTLTIDRTTSRCIHILLLGHTARRITKHWIFFEANFDVECSGSMYSRLRSYLSNQNFHPFFNRKKKTICNSKIVNSLFRRRVFFFLNFP